MLARTRCIAALCLAFGAGAQAALVIDPAPTGLGPASVSHAAFEGEDQNGGSFSGAFGGPGHSGVQVWRTPLGTHSHLAEGAGQLHSSSTWLMGRSDHVNTTWVKARGGSAAYALDRIRVVLPDNMGQAQQGSSLKFNWKIDGRLLARINSYSEFDLGVRNGFQWGYYSDVEAWFNYTDVTGHTSRSELVHREITRTGPRAPTLAQTWLQEFLDDDQVIPTGTVPNGVFEWTADSKQVDVSDAHNSLVLAAPGTDVEVFFGLTTGYNVLFRLGDTNPDLYSIIETDFGHTMELDSVELFNPDGSRYVGHWTLQSAAGLDYSELIVTPGVPLPGTLPLILAGLAPVWATVRRRRERYSPG